MVILRNCAILQFRLHGLSDMNGNYSPCGLAFAPQLPAQIPDVSDMLCPERALEVYNFVMRQAFNRQPTGGGIESRIDHVRRMAEWTRQDKLALKAGKLQSLHTRRELIQVPVPGSAA